MIDKLKRHKILLIFSLISFIFFLVFAYCQDNDAKMLTLDAKWLAVAGVPILIGLFIGGYIKTFKGFGVELEAILIKSITDKLVTKFNVTESYKIEKGSTEELENLPLEIKNDTDRLSFVYGNDKVYLTEDVIAHLKQLVNLKFIEVTDSKGKFKFVLPVTEFRSGHEADTERINSFIEAIKTRTYGASFPDRVTKYILMSDNIIEAYRKIKKGRQSKQLFPDRQVLPVLNDERKMIGIIDVQNLEKVIAEEVYKDIG